MQHLPELVSRRSVLRSAAWLGAGLAGSASVPQWARANALAETQFPGVARFIANTVAQGPLPGAVAALGWGEAPVMGIARGTLARNASAAVDLDSLYRIYSMTKPVTGMAAMMLIDEGKLRLDQPIADLLPKYAQMQVQMTPDGSITELKPAQTQITVRHLLTHTAGLGYSIVQTGPLKAAYEAAGLVPGRVSRLPMPALGTVHTLPSLAEFADKLADMPLLYEPGTQWSYSVSLDLLARVIELAAGVPYATFLQDRIFGPAGMTSTWFRVPEAQAGRLTTSYAVLKGTAVPLDPGRTSVYLDPPPFAFGGAGLASSPRDYDRFLTMLLGYGMIGGRRVMSEAAVRLGTSNLLPPGVPTTHPWLNGAGFGAGGRVGTGVDAGTFGWSGAAGTVGFINYRVGLRAGLYVQYMPSEALRLQYDFPKAVLGDVLGRKAA